MRRILLLLVLSTFIFACNNTNKEKEAPEVEVTAQDGIPVQTYEGEFIYTPEASVFKGHSFVYGVKVNDIAKDLAKRVEAVKKQEYDMVPVIIRGKVVPKPEGTEGWDEIITITEIINVSENPTKADIELKENKS